MADDETDESVEADGSVSPEAATLLIACVVGRPDLARTSGVPARAVRAAFDLTHAFDQHTIYWPTEDGFKLLRGPACVN